MENVTMESVTMEKDVVPVHITTNLESTPQPFVNWGQSYKDVYT